MRRSGTFPEACGGPVDYSGCYKPIESYAMVIGDLHTIARVGIEGFAGRWGSLQIDRLKMAGLVQLRPRHLMRPLVVMWTESDRRAQSRVEIMHSLKFLDEFF